LRHPANQDSNNDKPRMKKQIDSSIKAHLLRGGFYLLLLLAVCAIPFALAQRNSTRESLSPANISASAIGNAMGGYAIKVNPDGPCQFQVLIVYADSVGLPTQLQSEILAEPNVTAVDLFDATIGTPTLAQLQQYDIVVPFSNSTFFDADTLGNNLADYVDGGGIVVQYGFSFLGPTSPNGVNGRWVTGGYTPYDYSPALWEGGPFSLGTFNAGHPLMAGVTALNSDLANVVTLAVGATEVAQMNIGGHLEAFRPVIGGHTTVGVTAYVGAEATQSGDWGRVIVNAGHWLRVCGGTPTPTPTATVTATPTPTPSVTPRAIPTPRPRPTPLPRPTV
jgi:hypothetical protein